jgi:signal transduction histidine kinase
MMLASLAQHPDVRRARVEIRAASPPRPVPCNSLDIRRVIGNLIINAAQAVTGEARICVRITQDTGGTLIEVEDNGPGIPAHIRDRIFEPRFTTKATGNGIGLSSCRHIIEVLHGGRLTFESAEGLGTTFRCALPA